jgi:hypothetical protein
MQQNTEKFLVRSVYINSTRATRFYKRNESFADMNGSAILNAFKLVLMTVTSVWYGFLVYPLPASEYS